MSIVFTLKTVQKDLDNILEETILEFNLILDIIHYHDPNR